MPTPYRSYFIFFPANWNNSLPISGAFAAFGYLSRNRLPGQVLLIEAEVSMDKQSSGTFRLGTSNVVVPGSKETFPEAFRQKSRLYYYGSLFNSLEVNSTFSKLPMRSTLERWSSEVPEDFQFTIKLWREITHVKELKTDLANIETFINAVNYIGDKKGCLLVQFPGKITAKYYSQVEQILERLHQADDGNLWRKAVEFRSTTWHIRETHELLDEFDASMVLQDMPKSRSTDLNKAASFAYFRYHGPTGNYRGSYTDEFLHQEAGQIRHLLNQGKDVYCYFNNTMGNAYENAMTLNSLVQQQ